MSQKKEIEIKAKVKDFEKILQQLQKLGCVISESTEQIDRIYLPQGLKFEDIKPGVNVLRIRKQADKVFFTLKQSTKIELSKIEKEIVVSDPQLLHEIILMLGFNEVIQVAKKRCKTKYQSFELCFDDVEGLGTFIEIEKISSEDSAKVQEELWSFLKGLGVNEEDKVTRGYDTLLYYKGKN